MIYCSIGGHRLCLYLLVQKLDEFSYSVFNLMDTIFFSLSYSLNERLVFRRSFCLFVKDQKLLTMNKFWNFITIQILWNLQRLDQPKQTKLIFNSKYTKIIQTLITSLNL